MRVRARSGVHLGSGSDCGVRHLVRSFGRIFQSATSISIIAFATEANMKQYTGFVFACFSFLSSRRWMGALCMAKNWSIALWERFLLLPGQVNIGISIPVPRQASVGDHDHLLDYWRMPGPRRGSTATSLCCILVPPSA